MEARKQRTGKSKNQKKQKNRKGREAEKQRSRKAEMQESIELGTKKNPVKKDSPPFPNAGTPLLVSTHPKST